MSSISAVNGAAFLQSLTTTGNWMLDVSSAVSSNWMDPGYTGPDIVGLAANAFAKAHLINTTAASSIAVNQGITTLQAQLSASGSGQIINLFA